MVPLRKGDNRPDLKNRYQEKHFPLAKGEIQRGLWYINKYFFAFLCGLYVFALSFNDDLRKHPSAIEPRLIPEHNFAACLMPVEELFQFPEHCVKVRFSGARHIRSGEDAAA
jgi:hypothetical protein